MPAYRYKAKITRWLDGDTCEAQVDAGFHVTVSTTLRLYGIDTPERGAKGYKEATAAAKQLVPEGTEVVISTYKAPEKYGRWLAIIHTAEGDVATALISSGLGKAYFGGTKN